MWISMIWFGYDKLDPLIFFNIIWFVVFFTKFVRHELRQRRFFRLRTMIWFFFGERFSRLQHLNIDCFALWSDFFGLLFFSINLCKVFSLFLKVIQHLHHLRALIYDGLIFFRRLWVENQHNSQDCKERNFECCIALVDGICSVIMHIINAFAVG